MKKIIQVMRGQETVRTVGQLERMAEQYRKHMPWWAEKCTLVVDVGLNPPITSPEELELVDFLQPGERPISNTEEFIQRAIVEQAYLGQAHAQLLMEHAGHLLRDWQRFNLPLPGTQWRTMNDNIRIPILRYDRHKKLWSIDFQRLNGRSFGKECRLLRRRT